MEKILIVGINGTIGNAIAHMAKKDDRYEVIGTTSKEQAVEAKTIFVDFLNEHALINLKLPQKVDHVIITAGLEPQYNLEQAPPQHMKDMFGIHVLGPMLFLKKIFTYINKGGSITFVSSPAAYKGSYDPAYAAVKGAVNALVKTLAKDFSPNIRVNAIAPSLIIDSPVYARMTPDFRKRHLYSTLTKQHTTSDQCADAILFLIHSRQITGQILHINGGMVYGN